jgi:hypothetical protein
MALALITFIALRGGDRTDGALTPGGSPPATTPGGGTPSTTGGQAGTTPSTPPSTAATSTGVATTMEPLPTTTTDEPAGRTDGGETPPAPSTTASPITTTTVPAPGEPGSILRPAAIVASCTARDSTDARGNTLDFHVRNVSDGRPQTAWRCPGRAINETITMEFGTPVSVSSVGMVPGWDAYDPNDGQDRFRQNRKVLRVRWTCVDQDQQVTGSVEQTFTPARGMERQAVSFGSCFRLEMRILSSTSGWVARDFTAISEIELRS